MTREIINDWNGLHINTFWNSKKECVQITTPSCGYVQMSREEAIKMLQIALDELKKQIRADKKNPPWWQRIEQSE